jgi:flagellar basal body-associated protein FliL
MVVLVLVVIGIFLWVLLKDMYTSGVESARKQESQEWQQRTEILTQKLKDLEQELKAAREEAPVDEKVAEVFGAPAAEPPAREKPLPAEEIERRVKAFFAYLDSRDYVQAYALPGGTYEAYVRAVEALSASPPKVAGETESLYEMMKNVSYFFRTLGRRNVQLAAEILKKEPELMESAMRTFFQWYTGPLETLRGKPTLKTMYACASFLVDTFGGRSYLLRRDSKIRVLSIYYCIQVLDRANDQKMNPNGIDIRPLIAASARDIRNHKGLAYQKHYLAELERLARKYPVQS